MSQNNSFGTSFNLLLFVITMGILLISGTWSQFVVKQVLVSIRRAAEHSVVVVLLLFCPGHLITSQQVIGQVLRNY